MLTLEDLYNDAEQFLWDKYRMRLNIPIAIEDDYPEAEGWYEHTRKEPRRICISDFVIYCATDDVVYDILRHELVHHALHMRGEPFDDGDEHFEAELRKHGVGASDTTMVGRYYMYQCDACGDEIPHYIKLTAREQRKLRTHCCDATFTYKNEQAVYNGRERVY